MIPSLLPSEFAQLEANILQDGCLEPLSVWSTNDQSILLDGHNRYDICTKHSKAFETTAIELADRDHAKLWIATHQLGRRNLTDDQRADIANEVREIRTEIAEKEKMAKARETKANPSIRANSAHIDTPKPTPTRKAVATETKLPERKIRLAQEIKKVDPIVSAMVRAGEITLVEGRKIVSLSAPARQIVVKVVEADIEKGDKVDVRSSQGKWIVARMPFRRRIKPTHDAHCCFFQTDW